MKNEKDDRRIRRTQRLLKESLVELMAEKKFKDITIKDITERADLNRGTFYLHYTDTYGLLVSMENEVLNDFQDMINNYLQLEPTNDLLPILIPIIHYIVKNQKICTCLFENTASNDFMTEFKNLIHRNSLALLEKVYPSCRSEAFEYFFEFVIYGIIGIIKRWLNTGMPETEEEIARTSNAAVLSVAHTFFEPAAV